MLIKNFLGHVQKREVMYLPHLNLIEKKASCSKGSRQAFLLSFLSSSLSVQRSAGKAVTLASAACICFRIKLNIVLLLSKSFTGNFKQWNYSTMSNIPLVALDWVCNLDICIWWWVYGNNNIIVTNLPVGFLENISLQLIECSKYL